jgi:hypothetical protein
LPHLEDGLDPTYERGNLSTEVGIVLSRLDEVEELLTDQIVQGVLSAKLSFDLSCRITLLDPDFSGLHWRPSQRLTFNSCCQSRD